MTDPHPDGLSENDNEDRTDGEHAGSEPAGEPGAVGGTDGVTKNQDSDAQ